MQNIVVDIEQSLVKIIDFGLSNYWSLEEPLSTHCGSPEYAAPELFIAGRKYGPEVDLWSLGVVMFSMSAGCLPFCLNEREQSLSTDHQRRLLVTRIRRGIVEKHKNYVSHYSKEFNNLISGLLMKNPQKRFRIEQVLCHPWTTKTANLLLDIPKTVSPNSNINRKLIVKMCGFVNSMPKDIEKRIGRQPLGCMGGIYRILYHKELKRHWRLFEVFSPLHALSGSLSSGSLITKQRNRTILRLNAAKAKSVEICKATENESDIIYTSFRNITNEPWSSCFSSEKLNQQKSLIVTSLRSKNCPYNRGKAESPEDGVTLLTGLTTELENWSVLTTGVSTVESSNPSTRSERQIQQRRAFSADSKIGGSVKINAITERHGNNLE